jgi:hypothetical protein
VGAAVRGLAGLHVQVGELHLVPELLLQGAPQGRQQRHVGQPSAQAAWPVVLTAQICSSPMACMGWFGGMSRMVRGFTHQASKPSRARVQHRVAQTRLKMVSTRRCAAQHLMVLG